MFFEKANENVSEGIFFFVGSCDRMEIFYPTPF